MQELPVFIVKPSNADSSKIISPRPLSSRGRFAARQEVMLRKAMREEHDLQRDSLGTAGHVLLTKCARQIQYHE
jgi:hypothetical protein